MEIEEARKGRELRGANFLKIQKAEQLRPKILRIAGGRSL